MRIFSLSVRAVLTALLLFAPLPVLAASSTNGNLTGLVTTGGGTPLGGVVIAISGATSASTSTDSKGEFAFNDVPSGIYSITASHAGYNTTTLTDVFVLAGSTSQISVQLAQQSFSSIRSLGRQTVTAHRSGFNTTPASVAVITQNTYRDQGQVQVMRILDQTPGVVTGHPGTSANSAAPGAITFANIRGGLSFETASLIDGHPVSVGAFGDYVTTFLNSYLLQDVEVIKGPGASAPEINYAIGGTVNFRTREPTRKPVYAVDYGVYSYSGSFSNFLASGTTDNGKLGYVLDYAVNGTNGPLFQNGFVTTLSSSVIINNMQQHGFTTSATVNPTIQNNPFAGNATLVACCFPVSTTFDNKGELAKFRYNLSNSTSVLVSYLGSQTWTEQNGNHLSEILTNFAPAAAGNYNGPIPAGPLTVAQNIFFPPGEWEINNEPIFQAEARTTVGHDTALVRWYSASINRLQYNALNGPTQPYAQTINLYGTVNLQPTPNPVNTATPIPAPTLTTFRGQPVTISVPGAYFETTEEDKLHGGSFEYDHPLGESGDVLTLGYDQTNSTTNAYSYSGTSTTITVPAGSYQHFGTVLLRGFFELNPDWQVLLSNYYGIYTTHSSYNNGVNFQTATNYHYDVRAGFTYRPNSNQSWRLAVGTALAPPYLALVSTPNSTPTPNPANTFATNTLNNPNLKPETAFGGDVGGDLRYGDGFNIFSWDVYSTGLKNQFLSSQFANGTACVQPFGTPPGTPCIVLPLFTTQNQNLGKAYYGGIEASFQRQPNVGLGWIAQGALIRGFPYGIQPSFYATTAGPATTNLAIIPGVNYYSSGNSGSPGGFNAVSNQSIPYAQSYGELNYRGANGYFYSLGTTFYGNNNSYNVAPFFVWNATARFPFNEHGYIQLSIDNLFNNLSGVAINQFGGNTIPLANGKIGLENGNTVGPGTLRMFIHYQVGG
ncbi:MAG: TonB-dependent receptor [Candidatus Eremiobacteraeota bacterium]|nr:TonB-dependent receptor [Candidatus Eremiobacteraeota bacterium]MBV8366518.1 TonB-dependent receptor [Candidatus Eremiobacteraeota bacterium]